MKKLLIPAVTIMIIAMIAFACNKDENPSGEITGGLTWNSECKDNLKSSTTVSTTSDSLSCVEFHYNESTGKLTLKHINAGFNCCPGEITCTVSTNNDSIIIQEYEEAPLCSCNCLFDLDIEVNNVERNKYILKFIEPYVGNQEELIFEIDLIKDSEGLHCVTRLQYPWGVQ